MRSKSAALYLLAAVLPALPALAQEIAPHVSVGAEYSDNPFRLHSGAKGATILGGLVGLNVFHDGTLLFVDADASEVRLQTLSGGVPNQTLPNGYATIVGNFVPRAFTWSMEDSFGQISREPFDAITAPDRQTANVFSTGPDLLFPLGDRDHFVVRLRYGRASYNGANIDSSRYEGHAGLVHDLTETARVSAHVAYRKILYQQDQLYPRAETRSAFLRYTVERGRTELIAEGGWESMRFGSKRSQIPHVLLSLERRISPRVTLTAEFSRTYADAAADFVVSSRDAFTSGTDQNVQALASPFRTDIGYVVLSRRARRTRIAFELTGERDVYDAAPMFNRRTYGAYVTADHRLSSRLTFTLRGGWYREEYPAQSGRDYWASASALLSRQFSESVRVSVELARIQGSGSTFSSFSENRAVLTVSYDPAAVRRERVFNPTNPFRLYEEPNVRRRLAGPKAL